MNDKLEQLKRKIDLLERKKQLLEPWQIERTEKAIAKVERYRATRERNYNQAIEAIKKQIESLDPNNES